MAISGEEWRQSLINDSRGKGMTWLVGEVKNRLNDLKSQVKNGKLSVAEYQQILEPNAHWITKEVIGRELSAGSKAAGAAQGAGAYEVLDNFFSYDPKSGGFNYKMPFSRSEYAQLPESVLPTEEDAQKGLFDPSNVPMDRYKPSPQTGGPGPVPGGNGTNGNGITVVQTPSGGIEGGPTDQGRDEKKLLQEAQFAKEQREKTLLENQGRRAGYVSEIADLLAKQQKTAFDRMTPDIMEDLNARGLLRSSALGDRLSKEQANLTADTSNRLGLLAAEGKMSDLNAYNAINEGYLGDRGSAIGRRFSLEDFARQLDAAKTLGATNAPQVSSGGSGKGSGALQGAMSGAATGASVGGPWGAAAGGVIGAVGGGQLGSK